MVAVPGNLPGQETNITDWGQQKPELYLAPPTPEEFSSQVRQLLGIDDENDERLIFLRDTVANLPDYSFELVDQLSDSDEPGIARLGTIIIPEMLRTAVSAETEHRPILTWKQTDYLRDRMTELMEHDVREVRQSAQAAFCRWAGYWKTEDKTTYGWLEGSVEEPGEEYYPGWLRESPKSKGKNRIRRRYSDDISRRMGSAGLRSVITQ